MSPLAEKIGNMNDLIDNNETTCLPDFPLEDTENGIKNENLEIHEREREHERVRIDRRFSDMNIQFGELTSLEKILREKFTFCKIESKP